MLKSITIEQLFKVFKLSQSILWARINGTPKLMEQFDASYSPVDILLEHVTTHVIGTRNDMISRNSVAKEKNKIEISFYLRITPI